MQKTGRFVVWTIIAVLILLIPLAMQFQPFADEVQWNEAIAYGVILLIAGGFYELWQWLKTRTKMYRFAFGVGLVTALLLIWVNGAVGIIGGEDNPANLMYGAVLALGLVGSLISRFKPKGMSYTLFVAAFTQMLVPVIALIVWSLDFSPGVIGVFGLNAFFAALFIVSGLLFRRAANLKVL